MPQEPYLPASIVWLFIHRLTSKESKEKKKKDSNNKAGLLVGWPALQIKCSKGRSSNLILAGTDIQNI